MASDIGELDSAEKEKKRKRTTNSPKLFLFNEKVEIRSVEEGFKGSWHSGVVIACENRARTVRYDYLLCDDGSQNLVECINVHPIIDGATPKGRLRSNYLSLIRPLPPTFGYDRLSIHYGQCVDVYYEEAWWEGVVFDYDDGSEVRSIFFPDMGDEMRIGVDKLRITQEWDEFTQEWKLRGNWLFLELLEEFEQKSLINVSVKQIWYEVREKKGFDKIKEWTCIIRRDVWKNLMREVIDDNCKLIAGTCIESMLSVDFEHQLTHEADTSNSLASTAEDENDCEIVPVDADYVRDEVTVPLATEKEIHLDDFLSKSDTEEKKRLDISLSRGSTSEAHEKKLRGLPGSFSIEPCNPDESSRLEESIKKGNQFLGSVPKIPAENMTCPGDTTFHQQQIAGGDMVSEAEFCPKAGSKSIAEEGRRMDISSSNSEIHEETPCVPPSALSIVPWNGDECSRLEDSNIDSKEYCSCKSSGRRKWQTAGIDDVPQAEFLPGSVVEYLDCSGSTRKSSTSLKLDVRKHIAYLGWKIEFNRDKGMPRMRYTSPDGKLYMSLINVCKELRHSSGILSTTDQVEDRSVSAPPSPYRQFSSSPHPIIEPGYFPQAVKEYSLLGSGEKNEKNAWRKDPKVKDLQYKAKRHLRASGWSLWYAMKGEKQELRYTSPHGRSYYSLLTSCNAYRDDEGKVNSVEALILEPRQDINASDEANGKVIASERLPSDLPKGLIEYVQANPRAVGEHHNEGTNRVSSLTCGNLVQMKGQNTGSEKRVKKKHVLRSLPKVRDDFNGDYPMQCSKRAARKLDFSPNLHSPRTVLSWLIDNNVVLPRAKVYYLGRKKRSPMREGRITREGIKCSCCQIVFTLSKFEAHAGSTNHRPAANIFLEDGRSLLDCQSQLRRRNGIKKLLTAPSQPKRRGCLSTNDYICSACHFGGELVLCDHCPSSFHATCLGLKDVPDGEWFCPSCCCGICGKNKLVSDAGQIMEGTILNCYQCERQYHAGCLRKQGGTDIGKFTKGKWFCNKKCEEIFLDLRKLLGKPVLVGDDNLTWTLLKYTPCDDDRDDSDMEDLMETYCKLNVAVSVMHECFEPVKEPRTRRDIVEDVIFSRWSELNRLNFQGFYTVLLVRDDELITVATLRVHGEKVAEVPLVATRFQYRRHGMCRFLMNELEKKLRELGVERLVVTAAPTVLSTWTKSFGFSTLTESERLKLLSYTFLDFQGAVMCQKLLNGHLTESAQSIRSDKLGLDKNSTSSEVFQSDQIEDSEVVDQGPADGAVVGGNDGGNRIMPQVVLVNQSSSKNGNQLELLVEGDGLRESVNSQSGFFKCYKRRRISVC